jgi:hypothetical protein
MIYPSPTPKTNVNTKKPAAVTTPTSLPPPPTPPPPPPPSTAPTEYQHSWPTPTQITTKPTPMPSPITQEPSYPYKCTGDCNTCDEVVKIFLSLFSNTFYIYFSSVAMKIMLMRYGFSLYFVSYSHIKIM